ncbi:hypothetical protein [Thermococcus sp. MAR1]|uniref:hypothetical protein n=1 Tax=Thermococcus sp. MAR1 TaxID=1638263 RepID=UPI00143AF9BD|nr:hypothetical protein [Thermococcus sp. MAR1]NJE10573.1 hypothetical protein [Thermococcus sp. MAR1]
MKGKVDLKTIEIIGAIFGLLYLIYGVIESLSWLGWKIKLGVSPTGDLFAGLALITISAVYLVGLKRALENDGRAVAYIYVGALLGMALGGLALLTMGADAIETYIIHSEDFAGWDPLDDVTSYLILGVLSIFSYLPVKDVPRVSRE